MSIGQRGAAVVCGSFVRDVSPRTRPASEWIWSLVTEDDDFDD
jgi:hypothetical protein